MCTTESRQEIERREDGSPASSLFEIKEKVLGNSLRASVISYMIENITELSVHWEQISQKLSMQMCQTTYDLDHLNTELCTCRMQRLVLGNLR